MQIEEGRNLGLRQPQIIVHFKYGSLKLFQASDLIMEFGPLSQSSAVVRLVARLTANFTLRIVARQKSFALVEAPLAIGHVEQDVADFMRGETKKIGDGRRVGFVDGLHQTEPRFMDDAIDVVLRVQLRERAEHDFGGQSPESSTDLLQKLPPGWFIPLAEAVQQRLKLKRGILVHTTRGIATDCKPDSCDKSELFF